MRCCSSLKAIGAVLVLLACTAAPALAAPLDSVNIPEPASMGLIASGLIGLLLARRAAFRKGQ